MDGNCNECRKRNWCQKLCPEAIAYAEQDEVTQKELTVGIPQYATPKKKAEEYEPTKHAKSYTPILDPVEEKEEENKTEMPEGYRKEHTDQDYLIIHMRYQGWSQARMAKVLKISRPLIAKRIDFLQASGAIKPS